MEMLFLIVFLGAWIGLISCELIGRAWRCVFKESKNTLRRDRDYWRHKAAVLETEISLIEKGFSNE